MSPTAPARTRVLLELRPAADGHAGIPLSTRLLFRGLRSLPELEVQGLIQGDGCVLAPGLPARGPALRRPLGDAERRLRLERVVQSMQRLFSRRQYLETAVYTIGAGLWQTVGGRQRLSVFDPEGHRDYLWSRYFVHSLAPEDFDLVTGGLFQVARIPYGAMRVLMQTMRRIGAPPVFLKLGTANFDAMICDTPYPGIVARGTRLVIRYHDALPLLMPHTQAELDESRDFHYYTLRDNVRRGAWFVCVSETVRRDLLSIFPQAESRSLTIHNTIASDYFAADSPPERIPEIVAARRMTGGTGAAPAAPAAGFPYLLMVSTIEPRKNHLTLLAAWEKLRAEGFPELKLVTVGRLGWHYAPIVARLSAWVERGDVYMLENVPPADMRVLYRHARATICPSLGEGFGYSGVEAMQSGGAVIASDIPVHREIYLDAVEYCDAADRDGMAHAIAAVIGPDGAARRRELVARGAAVARRYCDEATLPQWRDFLVRR